MHETSPAQGVVAIIPSAGRLLVIRRSRFVVAPRAYCFPGGGLRAGESEEAAVVREVHEELGVRAVAVKLVWRSVTPWNVPLAWWLANMTVAQRLNPNPLEVESVDWLTPGQIRELPELLESNRHFLAAWEREEFQLPL